MRKVLEVSDTQNTQLGVFKFDILTLWDHYIMENYIHPTPKYPVAPKYPSLSIQKHQVWSLFVDIPWLRDMTTWDLYIFFSPSYPKISSCPKNTQLCRHKKIPSLESFLSTSLGFWDMGQHRTTINVKTFSILP